MAAAARKTPRKPKTPAPRVCRLTLVIGSTPYSVRPLRPEEIPAGYVRGLKLTRRDAKLGRVAHLILIAARPEWTTCTCRSVTYRTTPMGDKHSCKHQLACRATGLL